MEQVVGAGEGGGGWAAGRGRRWVGWRAATEVVGTEGGGGGGRGRTAAEEVVGANGHGGGRRRRRPVAT